MKTVSSFLTQPMNFMLLTKMSKEERAKSLLILSKALYKSIFNVFNSLWKDMIDIILISSMFLPGAWAIGVDNFVQYRLELTFNLNYEVFIRIRQWFFTSDNICCSIS